MPRYFAETIDFDRDDFLEEFKRELYRKVSHFYKTLIQFSELRDKLATMLDEAIVSGEVKVRTARDINSIVSAYAQLAESEVKLANAMASLMKALNERDSFLMVAVSAARAQNALSSPKEQIDVLQNRRLLVPVIEGDDHGGQDNDS